MIISRILQNFATMNIGNIFHHTFKMNALYCVKSWVGGQWWAQLTEKLASITDNPLTQKLASRS